MAFDLWAGVEQLGHDYGIEEYDLVDFIVLPHLCGGNLAADPRDFTVVENSNTVKYPVYALSDWAAVTVDGEKIEVVGHDWSIVENGTVVKNG